MDQSLWHLIQSPCLSSYKWQKNKLLTSWQVRGEWNLFTVSLWVDLIPSPFSEHLQKCPLLMKLLFSFFLSLFPLQSPKHQEESCEHHGERARACKVSFLLLNFAGPGWRQQRIMGTISVASRPFWLILGGHIQVQHFNLCVNVFGYQDQLFRTAMEMSSKHSFLATRMSWRRLD